MARRCAWSSRSSTASRTSSASEPSGLPTAARQTTGPSRATTGTQAIDHDPRRFALLQTDYRHTACEADPNAGIISMDSAREYRVRSKEVSHDGTFTGRQSGTVPRPAYRPAHPGAAERLGCH